MQVTIVDGAKVLPKDSGGFTGSQTGAGGFDLAMADVLLAQLGASTTGEEQDPGGTGAGSVSMVDVFPLEMEAPKTAIYNAETGGGGANELAQNGKTEADPVVAQASFPAGTENTPECLPELAEAPRLKQDATPGKTLDGQVVTEQQLSFDAGVDNRQVIDHAQNVMQEINAGASGRSEQAARAAAKPADAGALGKAGDVAPPLVVPKVGDKVEPPVSTEVKPAVPDMSGAVRTNPAEGGTSHTAVRETVGASGVNAPPPVADGKVPVQDLMEMPEVKYASLPGREMNTAAESKNDVMPGRATVPENTPWSQLSVSNSAAGATTVAKTAAANEAVLVYGPAAPVKPEPAPEKGVFAVVPDKAGVPADAGEQPVMVNARQQPNPEYARQGKNENMASQNGPSELKTPDESANVKVANNVIAETEHNVQPQARFAAGNTKGVTLNGLQDRVLQEIKQIYKSREGELQTRVQLKLEPEQLGQLTIKLYFQKGELNAHFYTLNNQVKEVLEGALQQLRDSLGQQDLRLNEAFVFAGNDSQDNSGGNFQEKHQSGAIAYGRYDNVTDGEPPAEQPEGSQITTPAMQQVDYLV